VLGGVGAAIVLSGLAATGLPAGAQTEIVAATGDIDLTVAAGNVTVTNTLLDAEAGNVNLSAPAGAVSVTGGSTIEATGNVTTQASASGSAVTGSSEKAGGNVTIAAVGSGSISDSTLSTQTGNVTLSDQGQTGAAFTVSGSQVNVPNDVLGSLQAVEVVAQGGCSGQNTSLTAIEAVPTGGTLTLSFPQDASTGCTDADFSYGPSGGTAMTAVVAGGQNGPNQVATGAQEGGVDALDNTSPPSVTLTFAENLPLAAITAPAPGGTYSFGASVPTSFSCLGSCQDSSGLAPPSGSLPTGTTGSQTYSVTSGADGFTFTAVLAYTVVPGVPQITWNPPASITYGTPLSATQLDATANVPGTFTYAPPAGTVLGAGTQTLSATFTPTDRTDYSVAAASVPLHVAPAPLTITASSNAEPFGLAIPAIQPSYSGFVNGDQPSSLSTAPTCSTLATAGSPVGTYATRCAGAVDSNYAISDIPGTMVITKAATTVTPSPISFLGSLLSVHVEFSGTLTSNVTGAGIPSQTVTFTWATGHCTAQTNASGVASCNVFILSLVPLTLVPHYTASYDGAANYQATEGTAGLKFA
jgi:hypothetical protein